MNTKEPKVSVVMSVYDQPNHVARTVRSVLSQTGIKLELIIIDDGANIAVKKVLNSYSSDNRVVVIEQENKGLTKALIKGCDQASYQYIARIDAGDTMSENRLSQQSQVLEVNSEVCLVTSWVSMQTEEGYRLYDIKQNSIELQNAVKSTTSEEIKTPIHASVMFRKSSYQKAGKYRSEFYFAQDCDLWSRMSNIGKFVVIPEFLTVAIFSGSGISGLFKDSQVKLSSLVAESNQLRKSGENDNHILDRAGAIRPQNRNSSDFKQSNFSSLYFLARCLSRNQSKYAKIYWWRAITEKPLSLLSWGNLFVSMFYWYEK